MTKNDLERDWTRFVDALHAIRGSKLHADAVQLACEALNVVPPDEPKATHIPTWRERCETQPEHQGVAIVSSRMIEQRMQEEIDELRAALNGRWRCEYTDCQEWNERDAVSCKTCYRLRESRAAEPKVPRVPNIESKDTCPKCGEELVNG